MRFLHLADLHIGKKVNGFSMLEDQRHVLEQVLEMVRSHRPQAVVIAGDVYDKPQPAAEAVTLCDWWLTELAAEDVQILIVPGNHDSAERLSFAAGLLRGGGIYIARPFDGVPERVVIYDKNNAENNNAVDFWLLPFLKPALVRHCFPEAEPADYDQAVGRVMQEVKLTPGRPSVLVMHQLITGATICDSEELAIGGLDNVDWRRFGGFNYVALGHLHSAQRAGQNNSEKNIMRYAGSPLKYSFSEARQKKSAVLVDMDAEGVVTTELLPFVPLRDLREIRGTFAELLAQTASEDYLHITLTDEDDVLEAIPRLRQKFPNLMKLDYDNRRTREQRRVEISAEVAGKSPIELFAEFYELCNNQPMNDGQNRLIRKLAEEIWENDSGKISEKNSVKNSENNPIENLIEDPIENSIENSENEGGGR